MKHNIHAANKNLPLSLSSGLSDLIDSKEIRIPISTTNTITKSK